MQIRDLKQQYYVLRPKIRRAMRDVFETGEYINGQQVLQIETRLATYVGVKHCLTCANGTDALTLALKALKIGHSDAVFVPDFTFFATAEVVALEGAVPVFVDVCEDTFNMDAKDLERKVLATQQEGKLCPKAVIAVDLFGLPADYPAIRMVTKRYGLYLIEDGAQGFGGQIGEQRACSFGDIATTSFHPSKPLGCYGDGGAVFTNNDQWATLIASLRVHGKVGNIYNNEYVGLNSRLDTLQAAILLVKLETFTQRELEDVKSVATRYTKLLQNHVVIPVTPEGYQSSWAEYTIRFSSRNERDTMSTLLNTAGIPTAVFYPKPMHKQTAFAYLTPTDDCPVATRLCEQVLSLPMHPYLTQRDINRVCELLCNDNRINIKTHSHKRPLASMRPEEPDPLGDYTNVVETNQKELLKAFDVFPSLCFVFRDAEQDTWEDMKQWLDKQRSIDTSLIINKEDISKIRNLNTVLNRSNEALTKNGLLLCHSRTSGYQKAQILKKYPGFLGRVLYAFHFSWHRVVASLKISRWFYMWVTKGQNQSLPRVEILGRMCRAGFDIIGERYCDGELIVLGQKQREPIWDDDPTNGLLVRLPRVKYPDMTYGVYQLRTIYPYTEYLKPYMYDSTNDVRINILGRHIQGSWLEKLPMIINLLKGKVKLVGVPPLSRYEFSQYTPDMQKLLGCVKPGWIPITYYERSILPHTQTFEEIQDMERQYIKAYLRSPRATDWHYFWRIVVNSFLKH